MIEMFQRGQNAVKPSHRGERDTRCKALRTNDMPNVVSFCGSVSPIESLGVSRDSHGRKSHPSGTTSMSLVGLDAHLRVSQDAPLVQHASCGTSCGLADSGSAEKPAKSLHGHMMFTPLAWESGASAASGSTAYVSHLHQWCLHEGLPSPLT